MDIPKPRSGRSSLLIDPDARLTETESTGSWEPFEWIEQPLSLSLRQPHGLQGFLLEAEKVIVEGYGVVLVNTNEAGTLFVTNYRLLFLSDGLRSIIDLGTIPFGTIEKFSKIETKLQSAPRNSDRSPSKRLLQVIGKDMRIIVFCFRPRTQQRRAVYQALLRRTMPFDFRELYCFSVGPSRFLNTNPKLRLLDEYSRLLGLSSCRASTKMIEEGSFAFSSKQWRISTVNSSYSMCSTYPFALLVPKSISDEELLQACNHRARCRLPAISWCHPETGAVLARSSQPLVGIMMNVRSPTDEKLVAAICAQLLGPEKQRRKVYIVDARPRKNALANGAMGGGSESSSHYFQSEVVFLGIDNIHAMRESLVRLRDYIDMHGGKSSDGMSSFLRHGGWTWGGGNVSSMSASVSTLGDSGWLNHVQSLLAGSAWIAARVALESASFLVHCSDGWDRTTQLISLACLLLDPYYRTIKGFQALVEKDWLAFGHPFADRAGMPSLNSELSRQSSSVSYSSPSRQASGSSPSQAPANSHSQNNYSPIFLQWVDCVSQLLRLYPRAFQFTSTFLVDLLDGMLSYRFGNFLCNSEKEREQAGISEKCGCLWAYLASSGGSHAHYNPFYEPSKHEGPLQPPAAALAPTVWPQFHLRWSCPEESQAGEPEALYRNKLRKCAELQKEKDEAETKVMEANATIDALDAELRIEKLNSSSAKDLADRATRESSAIKRALQLLGRKVIYSGDGDGTVGIEINPVEIPQKSLYIPSNEDSAHSAYDIEKLDPSDVSDYPVNQFCESLCPLRTQEGKCRWPNAGCAQFGSQFVGLKANFDAFDRLSINDSYFLPN